MSKFFVISMVLLALTTLVLGYYNDHECRKKGGRIYGAMGMCMVEVQMGTGRGFRVIE